MVVHLKKIMLMRPVDCSLLVVFNLGIKKGAKQSETNFIFQKYIAYMGKMVILSIYFSGQGGP